MEDKKEENRVKRYNGIVGEGKVDGPREITLSETSGVVTYPTPRTFEITSNTGGRTIKVESSDPAIAEVSLKGTTVTITPKVPTEDGKTITVTVTVGKKSVTYEGTVNQGNITLEAEVYTGTYDGNAYNAIKKVTVEPEDAEVMYALGDEAYSTTIPKVMGGGEYTVSIKASKPGYVTEEIIKTITVNKQENTNGNLSLSETSGTLTYPTTKTFTITKNTSGGVLSVTSSNPNVATVSLSGNTVTITPKAITADGQRATITVTSAATADYEAQTTTYTATVNRGSITLEAEIYSDVYDGASHDAITSVTVEPDDAQLTYSLNGGAYSTTIPKVKDVGEYTVVIEATKAGYVKKPLTKTGTIREAIARIGTDYYGTLQDAINAVPTTNVNTTVVLLKNTTENTTVAANKKITLNLNNYTVTGRMVNSGTIYISGGSLTSTNSSAIYNQGTLKVTGGTITSSNNLAISNSGTATISGGSISADSNIISNREGAMLEISGTAKIEGTTKHVAIQNNGTLKMTGGTITTPSTVISNYGTAIISGGSLTSTTDDGNLSNTVISNGEGAMLEISGTAKLEGKNERNGAAISNNGTAKVKGGTITSPGNTIYNGKTTSVLEISGGTITGTGSSATIYLKEGRFTMTGGTVRNTGGANYDVYKEGGTASHTGGSIDKKNF